MNGIALIALIVVGGSLVFIGGVVVGIALYSIEVTRESHRRRRQK